MPYRTHFARTCAAGFLVGLALTVVGPTRLTAQQPSYTELLRTVDQLQKRLDANDAQLQQLERRDARRQAWEASVVERLPKRALFNVILFRTGVEPWQKRLIKATPGMRGACRRWVTEAEPKGWTNLHDALILALADDRVDAVYVLTDGVPSRGTETKRSAILDEIEYLNHFRLVQINCVQAGGEKGLNPRWRGFLEELAKAHDGVSVRE